MFDETEIEKLSKELLKEMLSKQIDDDLKLGKYLQDICKEAEKCSNEHKIRVIDYINRVNKIYHPFVMLYAVLNNVPTSKGDSKIECNTLGHYVFIIEKVKEAKDLNDNFEHLCKILTIEK